MKIGTTINRDGDLIPVYQCPYCHMRTIHLENLHNHDCKVWSDAMAEHKEEKKACRQN